MTDVTTIRAHALQQHQAAVQAAQGWADFIARLDALTGISALTKEPTAAVPLPRPAVEGRMTKTERVARNIIEEAGRPVATAEMLRMLEDRGIEVGGKSPSSTLSARLSRAPSVRFEQGRGWTLVQPATFEGERATVENLSGETVAPARQDNHQLREGEAGGGT